MRIDLLIRTRRGSLALEAIMVVPVVVILVLLARFILDGMLLRQETTVHARNTAARAAMVLPPDTSQFKAGSLCAFNPSDAENRQSVFRKITAPCGWRQAEEGLASPKRFFSVLDTQLGDARFLHDDLAPWDVMNDILVEGVGTMRFENPPFLQNQGYAVSVQARLGIRSDTWGYTNQSDEKWKWGHDSAVWAQLKPGRGGIEITPWWLFGLSIEIPINRSAQDLFPNVFPAKDK